MNERLCPQCSKELTQVGQFWICPEHGQVSLDKPISQMRIFLSYGHDSNEELVRRIKADLEKRGHDVWFDKSEIKAGHDWRRSITEGIVASNRVLSFLSKHSTRDPGVCLDELAIAIGVKGGNIQTILVESETEVKAPPSIGHIQWLDMHDWKEHREADEVAWEKWYKEKLAEIVSVVESDESRRFAGEIRTLEEHLKPISSDSRIFQLLKKGLVGRVWLVEAIEKWRNAADRTSRLFWIMGAPGVGKSAFVAHLAHYGKDKVIAVQFCEYDKPDHRNAQRIVRTLAFQIATRLPDYRKLLLTLPEITELDRKNSAELFDYLLADPLRHAIEGGRERYLIIIDALDEAGGNGRNELVEMLAQNAPRLPDWIGIVVTSRPEFDVTTPLQGLNPFPLDTATESNRTDIRDYLRRELAEPLQNRLDADRLVEQILEKSEGIFLYVECFCDDVQRGYLSLDRPEQFPQGLGGIFFQYFKRQFPDLETFRKDVRPALRAILAAREPLPVEIIQRLFDWQDEELRDFTRKLSSLFPVKTEGDHEVIKPYHKSLVDWIADEAKAGPYFVSITEGNRLLANYCWLSYVNDVESMGIYEVRFAIVHLEAVGRTDDVCRLREDKAFQRRNLEVEIEASDAKHQKFIKISANQADLKNQLQILLNTMGQRRRWHPQPAECFKGLGAQEDYCEVYRFPCCGKRVLIGDKAPSQYRADGCENVDVCEILARAIHEEYLAHQRNSTDNSTINPSNVSWEELPENLKESNRSQADDIGTKLKTVGCGIAPLTEWDVESFVFTPEEIEKMAEMEHERWVKERINDGWKFGSTKDLEKNTSPYLIPWEQLTDDIKEYDRIFIIKLPAFLVNSGFQIYRL